MAENNWVIGVVTDMTLQGGPLPVISRVITPISRGYNLSYPCIRPCIIYGGYNLLITGRGPTLYL